VIQEKTGQSIDQLARRVTALIVTQGAEGSILYVDGKLRHVASVKPEQVLDPTGCGDAYRAGLLYGIANKLDWLLAAQLASLMGSIKIAHRGGQNHRLTRDEIAARFREEFHANIW
jgi:adenosine kinase